MSLNGSDYFFEGTIVRVETISSTSMTHHSTSSNSFLTIAHTLMDIQWGNLIISSLAGTIIHVYIAFSVLKRRLLNDKYMLLTYMRSYIDVIYLITLVYVQEVFQIEENQPYPVSVLGEHFLTTEGSIQALIQGIKRLAQQLQILLLMMMIVHRFLLFTRPGVIPTAYAVFFLICLVFCSVTGLINDKPSNRVYECVYMVLVSLMVIMAAVVHSSLRNYFTAHKYSTNVCEMQGKTSKFLLYCIMIYSICYVVFPLISIFCSSIIAALVSTDPKGKSMSAAAISFIIGQCLVPWLPLADGVLTIWSVRGYLSPEEPNNGMRISVVQSTTEP